MIRDFAVMLILTLLLAFDVVAASWLLFGSVVVAIPAIVFGPLFGIAIAELQLRAKREH